MSETVDPRARKMIARAWRDEEFRRGLPADVREKLPPAPEGASQMNDDQLEAAAGAGTPLAVGVVAAAGGVGYGFSELTD